MFPVMALRFWGCSLCPRRYCVLTWFLYLQLVLLGYFYYLLLYLCRGHSLQGADEIVASLAQDGDDVCWYAFFKEQFVLVPWSLYLRLHLWEEQHLLDEWLARHEHRQAVDANAYAAGWRHAILQGAQEVVVDDHGLVVALVSQSHLLHESLFLVNRVIELENGKAEFYAGNYSFYVEEKERRYEEKLKQYEKEQAKIEQLQEAADKLHLWAFMGADKLHKRAFSMEKRIERLRQTDRPRKERKLDIRFGEREFRGDEVLVVKDLSKSFDGRRLFSDVNLLVEGSERIALLGDNGTGKSTLLKILLGEEEADTGKVRMGPTVRLGYLPQIIHFDHPERSLVDTMLYDLGCSTQEARDRLAAFNFRGEDVFKPVSALSGGEQSRLRLCMLMDEKINLLILDEPTNHLDLSSREWIEEAVADYGGNLLFVSHDRYFIHQFANRIWMLEDGHITDFVGTFAEYNEFQERRARGLPPTAPVKEEPPKKEKPRRTGGTKNLEKEVNAAERAVTRAEEQMYDLTCEIEEAASDYLRLTELYARRDALEDEIAHLYAVWEGLAAELEEAKAE